MQRLSGFTALFCYLGILLRFVSEPLDRAALKKLAAGDYAHHV
jgi:hypothetical protein